jgi:hypothetical protein
MKQIFLSLIFFSGLALAEGPRCPVTPTPEDYLTEKKMMEMNDCARKKTCWIADRGYVCPWAIKRKAEIDKSPFDTTPEDREFVEETCVQCAELKKISCVYDLNAINHKYLLASTVFFSPISEKKPLIYGYRSLAPSRNNLNLIKNLEKLSTDFAAYQTDFQSLVGRIKAVSSAKTPTEVRQNIKTVRDQAASFKDKWGPFHSDIRQLHDLVDDVYRSAVDWQSGVRTIKDEQACAVIADKVDAALSEMDLFLTQIGEISSTVKGMNFSEKIDTTVEFAVKAIKLSYVEVSRRPLEELETSLAGVLLLDKEFSKSNLWWIELNRGGLAQGLHTDFYQYKIPLQRLTTALNEASVYMDTFRSIKGAPASAVNAAIKNQQLRIDAIQGDLDWLKSRGWQGQFASQKESAMRILEGHTDQIAECPNALKTFLSAVAFITSYESFEKIAEPKYIEAAQLCGVGTL